MPELPGGKFSCQEGGYFKKTGSEIVDVEYSIGVKRGYDHRKEGVEFAKITAQALNFFKELRFGFFAVHQESLYSTHDLEITRLKNCNDMFVGDILQIS